MKKTKQLAAVLLSLVMLLALVIPASAADTYSITIRNDKKAIPTKPTRFSPALCPAMTLRLAMWQAPCWVTSAGAAAWMKPVMLNCWPL